MQGSTLGVVTALQQRYSAVEDVGLSAFLWYQASADAKEQIQIDRYGCHMQALANRFNVPLLYVDPFRKGGLQMFYSLRDVMSERPRPLPSTRARPLGKGHVSLNQWEHPPLQNALQSWSKHRERLDAVPPSRTRITVGPTDARGGVQFRPHSRTPQEHSRCSLNPVPHNVRRDNCKQRAFEVCAQRWIFVQPDCRVGRRIKQLGANRWGRTRRRDTLEERA